MKAWPVLAISIIQIILLLAHWFVFSTWIAFWPGLSPSTVAGVRTSVLVLAFTFVAASLLAFRFSNIVVSSIYWLAAVWLGFMNYFLWASFICRLSWFAFRLGYCPTSFRPVLASVLYGVAALTTLYGLVNARILRIRRFTVTLPNLPASWRGRHAVVVSDLHLGSINGVRFCRRVAGITNSLEPDIVFLCGDLFDGTRADVNRVLAPLKQLAPPLGMYFSTGNHEEFTDPAHYIEAVHRASIRALRNELVTIDGMQVGGVDYHSSSSPLRIKAALDGMNLDRARPSILLNHAPTRLPTVEQAGFSLQLSGHTHGGQFVPFTWITRSIYGTFTTGLHRFGVLQVYTSSGAGSWGPPMRVGTQPEVVLITLQ